MKTWIARLLPVFVLFTLASSLEAAAQAQGACCVHTTTKLDALLNPVEGGDEKFFTSKSSGPPNVVVMIDNSASMVDWPFELCRGAGYEGVNGCACTKINDLGYRPATNYSLEIKNPNSGTFHADWFQRDKYFEVRPKRSTFNSNFYDMDTYGLKDPNSNPPIGSRGTNLVTACSGTSQPATCESCVATKGYYFDTDETKDVIKGNFLNFFAPKNYMARTGIKQAIAEIRKVRMAVSTFGTGGSTTAQPDDDGSGNDDSDQADWTTPPTLRRDFNPACNQLESTSSFDSNRASIMGDVDTIRFAFPYTPLSRSVLMAGFSYLTNSGTLFQTSLNTDSGPWYEDLGWDSAKITEYDSATGNQSSMCTACVFSAIILITDGAPNDSTYENAIPGLGTDITVGGCTTCGNSKLDEVTRWLWKSDMRTEFSGTQRVATFTVAFGLDPAGDAAKLLRSAANVGGGEYYNASTGGELKTALLQAFEAINSRNTAFSSANIASLQTGDTTLTAIIPRMRPQKNAPWSGSLYRFNQYNEFVKDLEHPQDNDLPDAGGYKADVFLVDGSDNIIVEDPDTGAFVRRSSLTTAATPIWEASERLIANGHASRAVYTVIDSNDDGIFSDEDTRTAFTKANAATLLPYMGLSEPGLCPNVITANLGKIFSTLAPTNSEVADICGGAVADGGFAGVARTDGGLDMGQQEALQCCAKVVIEWVRGREIGGLTVDGGSGTRDNVLGDIFHSSPVTVEPPANRFACDLGVSNQCVRTLYSEQLGGTAATPLATASVTNACGTVPAANAYDEYLFKAHLRERVVLVGANDGMLHAFKSGTGTADSSACSGGWPRVNYTTGNGDEAWAFIPPDQLPRIHERIFGHTYYIDGDTMVRDIWADTGSFGTKNADEFHTIAIAAEGRGGPHYFALELKWDYTASPPTVQPPDFRWLFPQPCTPESQAFGKTLYSLAPKPPPIGPVLLGGAIGTSAIPTLANGVATNTVVRYAENTTERWMVMLSGGWAPFLDKGRGLYMVDAWSAKVNTRPDNLWWKAEFDPGATGLDAPKAEMTHSFAAPVALVDYGQDYAPRLDGFFDIALAGDTKGQLWLTRMGSPAKLSATTGLIQNWPIARVFEQDRAATASHTMTDLVPSLTVTAKSSANNWPFFYLPSAALQTDTGALRAFIGTGNRYAILDDGPGICRFDNPNACSKYNGCGVITQVGFNNKGSNNVDRVENHWANVSGSPFYEHASQTTGASGSFSACGTGEVVARAGYTTRDITCVSAAAPTNTPAVPSSLGLISIACGKFGVDGGFYCRNDGGQTYAEDYIIPDAGIAAGIGNNRFYGVKVYGGGRFLNTFSDGGILDPASFDALRATDRGGTASTQLTNVTSVSCSKTSCDGGSGNSAPGWFYEYDTISKKTASGSVVLAGCVLWSDLFPTSGNDGGCGSSITAKSELIQSDFISGTPNCAFGFLNADGGYSRLKARDVVAPPPEPAMAIMIGPNQQIKYSAMIVEPGQNQATEVTVSTGNDVLQSVYELPISRDLHRCRHTAAGCYQ